MPTITGYRPIRNLLRDIEMSLGLANFYLKRTNGAIVLTYHGVAPAEEIVDDWVQSIHLDPSLLTRQLEFIARHFDVVESLDSDRLNRTADGRPLALVTFDDGYKNFLTHALPILEDLGLPATLFVTANCVENASRHPVYMLRAAIANLEPGTYDLSSIEDRIEVTELNRARIGGSLADRMKRMPWAQAQMLIADLQSHFGRDELDSIDEKYSTDAPMTWQEVAEVKKRGIKVGSHTLDHVILGPEQSPEEIHRQVLDSKQLITERIGDCQLFAYPNGSLLDISKAAVKAVEEAGYEQAFSTVPGVVNSGDFSANRFVLPRLSVGTQWNAFRKYVSTAWRHDQRHKAFVESLAQ